MGTIPAIAPLVVFTLDLFILAMELFFDIMDLSNDEFSNSGNY